MNEIHSLSYQEFKPISSCAPSYWPVNCECLLQHRPDVALQIATYIGTDGQITDIHLSTVQKRFQPREILYKKTAEGILFCERTGRKRRPLVDRESLIEMDRHIPPVKRSSCRVLFSLGITPSLRASTEPSMRDLLIMIIIEPDLQLFLSHMALEDLRELISRQDTYFILGEDWLTELVRLLENECLYLLDESLWVVLSDHRKKPEQEGAFYDTIQNIGRQARGMSRHVVEKLSLCKRRRPRPPRWSAGTRLWMCGISRVHNFYSAHLEILKCLSDAYSQEGLAVTFQHEVPYREAARLRLCRGLVENDPEVILFLNAQPDSFLDWIFHSHEAHEWYNLPRLVWLTDDFTYAPAAEKGFSEHDVVFCVDRSHVHGAKAAGAGFAFHLPSATCLNRRGKRKIEYSHPIIFVGSIVDLRPELSNLRKGARNWLEDAVTAIIQYREHDPLDSLPEMERMNAVAVAESICLHMNKPYLKGERAISYAVYVLANAHKRLTIVKALIPMGLKVYGNPDWKNLLDEPEREAYAGPIAYSDLPDLYASAKISLNIHSYQCPTCLNPRDFDVPMAGGFLLSDWVPEADEGYLVDGSEAVFYSSTPNLKECVEYYLAHEHLRRDIAEAGHERVSRDHRYSNRVRTSLRLLREAWHER